jgi:phosphate/sulfate permease
VKFIKLDKYKEEFEKSQNNPLIKQNDSSANASFLKSKKKFETAQSNFETLHPLINDYDLLGADSIASYAYSHGLLKDVEISRLKDEVRNANNYLVLEALAAENPVKEKEYGIAKTQTELYKEPLQAYLNHQLSIDSAIVLMNSVYPIQPQNIEKVKSKISKFNIQKSFAKDIEKSDNGIIVWGIIFTSLLFIIIYIYVEKIKTPTSYTVANMFKKLQLFSSAAFSIGHGGNDAQKVMGIIGAALIASGSIQEFNQLPNWVPIACYLSIGLGTMSGGWKIVKTMGTKITKVTPLEGVAAETAGAFTLFFTGQMGIPVSTTHTITGSIIGVGATKRLSAVRWGVTSSLMVAWILTIPVSAILAAVIYAISTLFF